MEVNEDKVWFTTIEEVLDLQGVGREGDSPVAIGIQGLLHQAETGEVVADNNYV